MAGGETEMDIEVSATSNFVRIDAAKSDDDVEAQFRIGFFLKDTLKVFREDQNEDKVEMSQCCYEQEIITLTSTQANDSESLEEVVHDTLLNKLYMDPKAAEEAKDEVASKMTSSIQSVRRFSKNPCTILMDVRVYCTIQKHGRQNASKPSGYHGYSKLQERVEKECGICHSKCRSPKDIIVTPCDHIYHRSCIFQWLNRTRHTCPMCRSNLGPIVGRPIEFP